MFNFIKKNIYPKKYSSNQCENGHNFIGHDEGIKGVRHFHFQKYFKMTRIVQRRECYKSFFF